MLGDPNIIATLAILAAPIAAFIVFRMYPPVLAAALTMVGGYLLLPVAPSFDLPVLPSFDKQSLPMFSVLLFGSLAIMAARRRERQTLYGRAERAPPLEVLKGWLPGGIVPKLLVILVPGSAIVTGLTNQEWIPLGSGEVLPGYSLYSTLSLAMNATIPILPVLIGRRLFAFPEGQKTLLKTLAIGGACYALLAAVEIRLSPQMNNWVYGFFPHRFDQHIRAGGFRPVVFLSHGLWLAIFLCMSMLAALGLYRLRDTGRRPVFWLALGGWMFVVLLMSNSLGALALALLFVPLMLFMPARLQMATAALIGLLMLTYPLLRERGMVPTDAIVQMAASVSEDRAQSLEFRLVNEDQLLARTSEKSLGGWGGYGRGRIYDPVTGQDLTVVDGYWIAILNSGGLLRYVAVYGLLTFAFWALLFRGRKLSVGPETSVLSLMLAVNLVDMVPNATGTVITGLLAGALLGRLEVEKSGLLEKGTDGTGVRRGGRMRHRSGQGSFVAAGGATGTARLSPPETSPAGDVGKGDAGGEGGNRYSRYARGHRRAGPAAAKAPPRG